MRNYYILSRLTNFREIVLLLIDELSYSQKKKKKKKKKKKRSKIKNKIK